MAGALRAKEAAAGVTVIPAGAPLAEIVTVPLNPLTGASARVLVADPEGEIVSSGFWVVSEKSDCAMATLTALDVAAL